MDATRKHELSRLERQGMTYDEDRKGFTCEYCPNGIGSRHIANAWKHVRTEKHHRFYNDKKKELRDDAMVATFNDFAKQTLA